MAEGISGGPAGVQSHRASPQLVPLILDGGRQHRMQGPTIAPNAPPPFGWDVLPGLFSILVLEPQLGNSIQGRPFFDTPQAPFLNQAEAIESQRTSPNTKYTYREGTTHTKSKLIYLRYELFPLGTEEDICALSAGNGRTPPQRQKNDFSPILFCWFGDLGGWGLGGWKGSAVVLLGSRWRNDFGPVLFFWCWNVGGSEWSGWS